MENEHLRKYNENLRRRQAYEAVRVAKLAVLADAMGYEDPADLLEEYGMDSVNPGICVQPDCDYTTDVEPDCRNGYCEECGTSTVESLLVLLGIM